MSFDVVFTKSAEAAAAERGDLPDLEERARDAIAELPGAGTEALQQRMFHAVEFDDGTDLICSLTADGSVRVDFCEIAAA